MKLIIAFLLLVATALTVLLVANIYASTATAPRSAGGRHHMRGARRPGVLVLVISFHHVGRDVSGIMEVTAFAQLESFEGSDDRERVSEAFFPTSMEPFVITWKTREADIARAFERWLDAALAVAIKEFGDRL